MTTSILTKVATDGLAKQGSVLLDALFAPKIERLKKWSRDRDILSQFTEEKAQKMFESYLRRLLRRVSGIQTLVFPQQTLSLPLVYEPLRLRERYVHRSFRESDLRSDGSRVYIIDGAGMGKSTFSKYLVLREITDYDKVPIFVEFNRLEKGQSVLEYISKGFDETGLSLAREEIQVLFSIGRFLIVFDGYDEIPAEDRKRISKEISDISAKCEHGSIIVTSRPEVTLPEMSEARVLEFKELEESEAIKLIRRYDSVAKLEIGERLIQEIDKVPEKFLETPLLVSLLYKTYGFNGSVSSRISTFYDEIYSALYKGHDLSKAGFSRDKESKLDIEDFRRLLRAFCFLITAHQQVSFKSESEALKLIDDASRMVSKKPVTVQSFLSDLLMPVPLLVRDGSQIRFAHKTISEFFAAEHIVFSRDSGALLSKVQMGPLKDRFYNSVGFIAELDPLLFRRLVAEPIAKEALPLCDLSNNPVYRTMLFIGGCYISLWRRSDVMKGSSGSVNCPPPPSGEPTGEMYFYGDMGGDSYVLVVACVASLRVPRPAWEMITVEIENGSRTHLGLDFSGLENLIAKKTWLRLDESLSDEIINHPAVENAFKAGMSFSGYAGNSRVIDKNAICGLIESVLESGNSEEWLRGLLEEAPVKSPPKKKYRK